MSTGPSRTFGSWPCRWRWSCSHPDLRDLITWALSASLQHNALGRADIMLWAGRAYWPSLERLTIVPRAEILVRGHPSSIEKQMGSCFHLRVRVAARLRLDFQVVGCCALYDTRDILRRGWFHHGDWRNSGRAVGVVRLHPLDLVQRVAWKADAV